MKKYKKFCTIELDISILQFDYKKLKIAQDKFRGTTDERSYDERKEKRRNAPEAMHSYVDDSPTDGGAGHWNFRAGILCR